MRSAVMPIWPRRTLVNELPRTITLDCVHESVGHCDADIEIAQLAAVLGVDEILDIGMVAAQDAHLGTAARACGFHRLTALVEHAHVGDGSACAAVGPAHQCAL